MSSNFTLPWGPFGDLTVEGGAPIVNTESAAVENVVDDSLLRIFPWMKSSNRSLDGPGRDNGDLLRHGPRGESPSTAAHRSPTTSRWMASGQYRTLPYGSINSSRLSVVPRQAKRSGRLKLSRSTALQEFRITTSTSSAEDEERPAPHIIPYRSGTKYGWIGFDYFRNEALR